MRREVRVALTAVLALAVAVALSACEFTGINNQPLPFTKGGDEEDLRITIYLENAVNLVPNSEVKVNDVTVGSVRKIEFDGWRAKLTVGIEDGTPVPANVDAKIGQKSLLGAEYLELEVPKGTKPAEEQIAADAVIPLERTGRYPETEEVLASAAALLNGGGLAQINTITKELNNAIGGREGDVRSLIDNLNTFVGTLDAQTSSITRAIKGLDRLSSTFADQRTTLATALEDLPGGIETLRDQRKQLTKALQAIERYSTTATRVIRRSKGDLVHTLRSVQPVLRELADSGDALTGALGNISFPFPIEGSDKVFRGDYLNFFATIDLSIPTLERDFLAGTPLDGLLTGLTSTLPTGTSDDVTDPLRDPVKARDDDGLDDAPTNDDLEDLVRGWGGALNGQANRSEDAPVTGELLEGLLGDGS